MAFLDNYTDYGLLIYCLIERTRSLRGNYFQLNTLLLQLGVRNNHKQVEKVKQILECMIKLNYLVIYEQDDIIIKSIHNVDINNMYICNIQTPDGNYFKFCDNQFNRLAKYKSTKSVNRFKLISYYLYIRAKLNNSTISMLKNSDIHSILKLSDNTITNYNRVLEDLDLIRYCSSGFDTDKLKEKPNVYSSYEDLATLKKHMLDNYSTSYDTLKLQKKERDLKRSIKLKDAIKQSEVIDNEKT